MGFILLAGELFRNVDFPVRRAPFIRSAVCPSLSRFHLSILS